MKPEPISLPVPEGSELLVNSDASARVRVQEVGDRAEQFTAFVDSVGPYLLHTAELLCGDKARHGSGSGDLRAAYRSWSKARDGDPRAYARRILVNLRIDGWRRTRRELLSAPVDLPDTATPTTLPPPSPAPRWSGHSRDSPSRNGAWSPCAICST